MKITVVGLGKIGLPLALEFAKSGHEVFGAGVNAGVAGAGLGFEQGVAS